MCARDLDKEAARIASMGRPMLVEAILTIDCGFPVDLTQDALATLSVERLRHLYLALQLRAAEARAKPRRRRSAAH